jgi:lipoate-protein ligase B
MAVYGSSVRVVRLGQTEFKECWQLQQRLCDLRREGRGEDTLLFTEHHHVYTIGTAGNDDHLLARDDELRRLGARVHHIDRGGGITYHGPGQLVGYPILDLHSFTPDLHKYLRDLEEVVIRALKTFGLRSERTPGYTGVWIGDDKICAIGVKASRWVTMHGFALNVDTDLSYFDRIIPCGIFEKGATSLARVLGGAPAMQEVIAAVTYAFGEVFEATMFEEEKAWTL